MPFNDKHYTGALKAFVLLGNHAFFCYRLVVVTEKSLDQVSLEETIGLFSPNFCPIRTQISEIQWQRGYKGKT